MKENSVTRSGIVIAVEGEFCLVFPLPDAKGPETQLVAGKWMNKSVLKLSPHVNQHTRLAIETEPSGIPENNR